MICSHVYASRNVPEDCARITCAFGSFCDYQQDGTVGCVTPDHCADSICPCDTMCIPEPKNCIQEPCPQYRCQTVSETPPCIVSGCSEELCGSEEQLSPCIFKPEFACHSMYAECTRNDTGDCSWVGKPGAQNVYELCLNAAIGDII